ncbi:MAG: preprotein translocase subunit SecE [Gemmatimonadetes bacterium]|jgi:preprotein translocase subunit SecE|nr:preprotein translocase subunit SecE [Gemmatimonadota bacterium]MDD9949146.1 preprotein translocase subunit SecE [candidate division Zixibacteria bacterium]MCY3713551.1 preprotein translocase subunit SecE [Gemmatimonadota bacterium]MCY4544381.1 preprotein translocase subunit SecE [Gemmatimonadota bacterium]MDE2729432.1 preprotein translocase subunit SecE [Gemmatimonadota bacterium]
MYERTVDFLREVRTELSKVSWPSRNELIGSTTVVIIITLILAAFTGVIDFILSIILSRLLGA